MTARVLQRIEDEYLTGLENVDFTASDTMRYRAFLQDITSMLIKETQHS